MEPNWKSQFVTKAQVVQALEEMKTKTKWGRWTLDTEVLPSLDICPYPGNNAKYEVPLFQAGCDFPIFTAWLGHWTQHLQEKGWCAHKDLWDFVDAAQDIFRRGGE